MRSVLYKLGLSGLCLLLLLTQLPWAFAETATVTYLYPDAQGSVVAAADAQGRVLWRERYAPYGERQQRVVSTDEHAVFYTGKPHDDATGLSYLGARYYDPALGRFLSEDSVGSLAAEQQPMLFNRYAYAHNNPYKYTDPDGRNAVLALGGVVFETGQWLQGKGFDGSHLVGALVDGYNGEGDGLLWAAGEDVLNFGSGAAAFAPRLYRMAKGVDALGDVAKGAYEVASEGGKHAGFLRNYAGRSVDEIDSGIASIERQIAEHRDKIANPEKYIPNFRQLDVRQQEALVNKKWPSDIQRQSEQLDILRGLRNDR